MTREIEFRVWDKKDKRMIIHQQDFVPVKVTNHGVFKLDPSHTDNLYFVVDYENDRFEIMEYTGLKDSNGKKIYEGDILTYVATNMSDMEVKFINGSFVGEGLFNTHPLSVYFDATDFQSLEVAGNIYQK